MSDKKKKKWTRPQLVIIGRGSPEERVLATCKTAGAFEGPDAIDCQSVNSQGACQGLGQS